jgi:hypothetical protein
MMLKELLPKNPHAAAVERQMARTQQLLVADKPLTDQQFAQYEKDLPLVRETMAYAKEHYSAEVTAAQNLIEKHSFEGDKQLGNLLTRCAKEMHSPNLK